MSDSKAPSPEELEAIRLLWRREHRDADPPPEEVPRLLLEVRRRASAIEGEALKMLMRASRQQASRSGFNSDYMRLLVFYVLFPLFILGVLIVIVGDLMHASP